MGKRIQDLTDDELDALSPEEMAELEAGIDTVDENNVGGDGDEDEDLGGAGDKGDDDEEEEEEEAAGDGELPTREQLEALAKDDDSEEEEVPEGGEAIPYARFKAKSDEAKDLRGILKAVIPHLSGSTSTSTSAAAPAAPVVDENPRPVYDIKAANREYTRLLSEGDVEAAAAKLDEIEDAREKMHAWDVERARLEAEERAVTRVKTAEAQSAVQTTAAALYATYPFLDNKNAAADATAIIAVNAEAKRLMSTGMAAAAALQKAGETLGKRFAKLIAVEKPAGSKPAKDGKDGKPPAGTDPRSKEALKRNLGIRQPPSAAAGVSNRDEPNKIRSIADMSDEEIDKLSKEELAELRGDKRVS